MAYIVVVLSVFLSDLLLKKYVEAKLPEGEERRLWGGKIRIRKLRNRGIAMGSLARYPGLILRGTALVIIGVATALAALLPGKGNRIRKTGLSLVLGGSLCNWFDRFHQGAVTDYFSFQTRWKKLSRMVFNLSDFCIFAGGIMSLFGSGKRKNK